MRFEDSLLYAAIDYVVDIWEDNSLYYIILKIPLFLLTLTVGVVLSLIIDFITAIMEDT